MVNDKWAKKKHAYSAVCDKNRKLVPLTFYSADTSAPIYTAFMVSNRFAALIPEAGVRSKSWNSESFLKTPQQTKYIKAILEPSLSVLQ